MKKVANLEIIPFEYRDGFNVDIVDDKAKDIFEAWLYHVSEGNKSYMFGVPKKTKCTDKDGNVEFLEMSFENFLSMVEGNIESYISISLGEEFDEDIDVEDTDED